MTWNCAHCKLDVTSKSHREYRNNSVRICTDCKKKERYNRCATNPIYREQNKNDARRRRRRIRRNVLAKYGNKCKCCGEDKEEFLSIDHVNGGGNEERKTLSPASLYLKLSKEDHNENYRLLCHNCNQSRGIYGYCPHETETDDTNASVA